MAYVEWFGAVHQDDCPADDTCGCDGKPMNDGANLAIDLLTALAARDPIPTEDRETLEGWLTRYGQILEATDKLLHDIRFCSNAEELWRMVGFSQAVEDLHTRVIYESEAVEKAKGDPLLPASQGPLVELLKAIRADKSAYQWHTAIDNTLNVLMPLPASPERTNER